MRFAILGIIGLLAVSCEKSEGFGGTSTIKGVIMTEEWNAEFTKKKAPDHPAQQEDVYIVFGEDDYFGDKVETDYDGTYEFNYLQEGTYVVYVYSKDPAVNYDYSNQMAIVTDTITISGKDKTVLADTLWIKR